MSLGYWESFRPVWLLSKAVAERKSPKGLALAGTKFKFKFKFEKANLVRIQPARFLSNRLSVRT